MWFLPFFAVVAAVPPSPPIAIPAAIQASLDQEYPGWKLAPVSPQIQQTFKKHKGSRLPSLVIGDFDHDGNRDYALQIALTETGQEEQIVLFFMDRGPSYEETIVQSMGLDPSVYLWVSHQSTQKDVLRVLGGAAGDAMYGYENGQIQEITAPEDPDNPDASIPRVQEPL
jgi:hypothetical protein